MALFSYFSLGTPIPDSESSHQFQASVAISCSRQAIAHYSFFFLLLPSSLLYPFLLFLPSHLLSPFPLPTSTSSSFPLSSLVPSFSFSFFPNFPSPNRHARSQSRPSVGYFTYPLASLSTHKIPCSVFGSGVYSLGWSLASSEDVTASVVWFTLLEIKVFCCLFLQPSGLSLCGPPFVSLVAALILLGPFTLSSSFWTL
ncbi:hypothetical protein DVH24_003647 [Malus domestica]|uniref:Uncharacterized protein n=1 Tax=Malus domestica TaxID=3750 RepID=A0A498IJ33_MALDO|nr:hypothetical protein DVH24_003647 [Malus domestica]